MAFKCVLCNKSYSRKQHLSRHVSTVHNTNVKIHQCPNETCTYTSPRLDFIAVHLRACKKGDPSSVEDAVIRCDVKGCGRTYTSRTWYAKHRLSKHTDADDTGVSAVPTVLRNVDADRRVDIPSPIDGVLHCPFEECERKYTSLTWYIKHIRSKHALLPTPSNNREVDVPTPQRHQCDVEECTKTYAFASGLSAHRSTEHPESKVHANSTFDHLCTVVGCTAAFQYAYSLRRHIQEHHRNYCLLCQKQLSSQPAFSQHNRNKHRERKYNCSVCSNGSFAKKEALQWHMNTHTGQTPFNCGQVVRKTGETCTASFAHPFGLTQHQQQSSIHTTEKKFQCGDLYCDLKFYQRSHVSQHMVDVHGLHRTNESKNNLQCELCHRQFMILVPYTQGKETKLQVCKRCFFKRQGYKSRIEYEVSKYLDTYFGTQFLLGTDRQLRSIGGTSAFRPDKLYIDTLRKRALIVECDEYQHRGYCPENELHRIDTIRQDVLLKGYHLDIIRFNPDYYTPPPDEVKSKVPRHRRKRTLVDLMQKVWALPPVHDEGHSFYFLFYTYTSRHIPHDRRPICVYTTDIDVYNMKQYL